MERQPHIPRRRGRHQTARQTRRVGGCLRLAGLPPSQNGGSRLPNRDHHPVTAELAEYTPVRRLDLAQRLWCSRNAATSSTSIRSARRVNPARSHDIMGTTLRASRRFAPAGGNAPPQVMQNRAAAGLSPPRLRIVARSVYGDRRRGCVVDVLLEPHPQRHALYLPDLGRWRGRKR
jgi:hypothetical protein